MRAILATPQNGVYEMRPTARKAVSGDCALKKVARFYAHVKIV